MKVHFEPYLCLAGVSHKSALFSWGGFYFKFRREDGPWKLLDDGDLDNVHPPRRSSIGARSDVYGRARVEVLDATGKVTAFGETTTANWRIPFSHHPPYCAGSMHGNSESSIAHLVPLYRRSGVRLVLSGHEHNFEHSRADGIDYFVTGGGGKVRSGRPGKTAEAHTLAWAAACHFLLVQIDGNQARVTPIGGDGRPLTPSGSDGGAAEATTAIHL